MQFNKRQNKMILKGTEAKDKLLKGINDSADVVKQTMGPKGRNVLVMDNMRGVAYPTKDGVTVAKHVRLNDPIENAGANIVLAAANKTVEEAGDGTTTCAVLTQTLCEELQKAINLGQDPHTLTKNLKLDLEDVLNFINQHTIKVTNTDEIRNLAMVSSNADEEISDTIKSIYDELGFDAHITTNSGNGNKTYYEAMSGYTIPHTGYASPYFINNQKESAVVYENPLVVIFDNEVTLESSIFTQVFQTNNSDSKNARPVVFVVREAEESLIYTLVNALESNQINNVVIVTSNLPHEARMHRFQDASIFLGGIYMKEEGNFVPGECDKVVITKDKVTFIGGKGDTTKLIEYLEEQIKNGENYKERLDALKTSAAVIHIGGELALDIQERKDRVDDAILTVKSAVEEGYCPGGASIYNFASINVTLRTEAMKKALRQCLTQILRNAGKDTTILYDIHHKKLPYSYNGHSDKVEDMMKAKIFDSAKVLRVSLNNAVHASITFALIESVINN